MKDEGRTKTVDSRQRAIDSISFSPHSLRWRLFLTLMIVAVVAVAFVALIANLTTTGAFARYVLGNVARDQWTIARLLESQLAIAEPDETQQVIEAIGSAYGREITLADIGGETYFSDLPGATAEEIAAFEAARSVPPFSFRLIEAEAGNNTETMPIVVPIPLDMAEADLIVNGIPTGWEQSAIEMIPPEIWARSEGPGGDAWAVVGPGLVEPGLVEAHPLTGMTVSWGTGGPMASTVVSNEQSFVGTVNRFFWLAAVGAVAMAGVLSFGLSRRILRPVQRLTEAARQMETGDLNQRVAVVGKDEISELGHAFNAMAGGLQQQEQLRRNMVTDIAHELRTPLSNIRGYLEAVQDGMLVANDGTLHTMHEEVVLLSRLVDDLQELSLAEAGQLRLDQRPVSVTDIIAPAVKGIRPVAQAKGVTLETELPDDLPLVTADAERTGQVLRNLLQNAVAHTPPNGRVVVAVQRGGVEEQRGRGAEEQRSRDASSQWAVGSLPVSQSPISTLQSLVIAVSDNGPGIAAEHVPFVFDRFYRADTSRTRATGGSGLGLAIAKALVEMQGGRIWVASKLGVGTTFFFTLAVSPNGSVA